MEKIANRNGVVALRSRRSIIETPETHSSVAFWRQ